jgi:hypothetical protein
VHVVRNERATAGYESKDCKEREKNIANANTVREWLYSGRDT